MLVWLWKFFGILMCATEDDRRMYRLKFGVNNKNKESLIV